jgi:beta-N-acetylhexosaminidase
MWRAAGLILLALGANCMDPYLYPIRSWGGYAIAILGAAGAVAIWRKGAIWKSGDLRRRVMAALFLLIWAGVPVTVLAAKGVFAWRKAEALSADSQETRALGQHFMVGYSSLDEVETLAAKGLIGGVYITGRNVRGRSVDDIRRDVGRLQQARRAAGLPPLIIATDQEGGFVSHLSPPLAVQPMLSELANAEPRKRAAAAHNQGAVHGLQLASVGVTVNLAPVLDLRRSHPYNPFDLNSHIEQRAISGDPEVVGEVGLAYSQGLEESGVTPAVKHFPGLGRLATDTHHFRTSIDASIDELEASDWAPFHRVLAGSGAMMMVGHVVVTAVDPDRPASHSRAVIDGLLRRKWGYQGVLITDDMNMSPIYHHGLCNAVVEGLNAGMDLLLIAFDGQQYYRAMRCAMEARELRELDDATLAASDKRLEMVRQRSEALTRLAKGG